MCKKYTVYNKQLRPVTIDILIEDIKNLEKVTEVIDIPKEYIYNGWTNCIRIGNKIFHAWDHSNNDIEDFYAKLGYLTIPVKLDEFDKSGADLSCLVMHLNYMR